MASKELANFLSHQFKDVLIDDVYYKSNKPPHKGIKSEASVLILLDKRGLLKNKTLYFIFFRG